MSARKSKLRSESPEEPRRKGRITFIQPAWLTVFASIALALLGVYCINLTAGVDATGMSSLSKKQFVFLPIALFAGFVAAMPHYKALGRISPLLAIITLAMLLFLLVPFAPEALVSPRKGAKRWINLGPLDFQPSEIAKIVYVLVIAWALRFKENHRRFLGLAPPAAMTFVPMALILVEPDLGTSLLFLPSLFAMLIAAGAKLKHLAIVVAVAIVLMPAMYPLLQPHQKSRVQAIVYQLKGDDSHADSVNYQAFRAMTIAGAGGTTGQSAGKSRALIDYNALPEDHNDMIFAVIANRFGLLGGVTVMLLYLIWLFGALASAAICKDPFGRLVIVGLSSIIVTQAIINIGMTIGILPITGMTLPFVSYGGSSLVASFLTVGLIFNVAMRRTAPMTRHSFEFGETDDDS